MERAFKLPIIVAADTCSTFKNNFHLNFTTVFCFILCRALIARCARKNRPHPRDAATNFNFHKINEKTFFPVLAHRVEILGKEEEAAQGNGVGHG